MLITTHCYLRHNEGWIWYNHAVSFKDSYFVFEHETLDWKKLHTSINVDRRMPYGDKAARKLFRQRSAITNEYSLVITSWSMSRLEVFEACPYRAYLEYVEKQPVHVHH